MIRPAAGVAVLVLSALWSCTPGCVNRQSRAREESAERWNHARAQLKAKLAADHLSAGHIEDAATELAAATRLDPTNPGLLTLQARVCLARGELMTAQRLLEEVPAEAELRAEIEYLQGVVQEQRLDWPAALEHYRRATEAAPQEVAYLVAIVHTTLQLGQTDDALALLELREPQFGWTDAYHAALAECREQLEDWAGAASAWRKVADAHDDAGIRERLAIALYRAGNRSEAIQHLEALLQEAGPQADTTLRLALAQCLLEEGQPAEAHEQLSLVLRAEPRDIPALRLVARVFAQQRQFDRALQAAERALRLDRDNLYSLELAATLALRSGQNARALTLTERITQLAPDSDNLVAQAIRTRLSAAAPTIE
jgi:tetratricopeptide (TPR) repeat protein